MEEEITGCAVTSDDDHLHCLAENLRRSDARLNVEGELWSMCWGKGDPLNATLADLIDPAVNNIDRITAERDEARAQRDREGAESVHNLKRAHAAEAERDALQHDIERLKGALELAASVLGEMIERGHIVTFDSIASHPMAYPIGEGVMPTIAAALATSAHSDAESKGGA